MSLVQKSIFASKTTCPKGGSMSYRNVGVDLGVTAKHKAQVLDEQGKKIVPNFSFHTSKDEFDALCQQASKDADQGTKLRFICEPTEMSWFPLSIYAKNNNHEIVRVKSHKSHDLRKYFARHQKNDKLDAQVLAVMPMIDEKAVEGIYLPNAKTFALERRNRQKDKITQEISAIKNRFSSLYHWVMPGLLDCFEEHFDSRARKFYRRFTDPFKAKQAGINGIKKVLEPAGRQQMNPDLPEKLYSVACRACELYANAANYVDFKEIQDEVQLELQHLEALEKLEDCVKKRVQSLYEEVHPSKNIETIKGVGENLGASFVGLIGDPNRFSSQKKLRCFAGVIPKQNDSGENCKKGLPLTQEGPARFRRDLFLAADVSRQWDPQLAKIYYEQMVHKGHCHTQAVCAVVTHLVNRILCIFKEDRPYKLRDIAGNEISAKEAKRIIKEQFTVPEEVRQRTRSRRTRPARRDKKEERIRNLFKRHPGKYRNPQNSYNIPPKDMLQNFEKFVKCVS